MRAVYALLALGRKYGSARLDEACERALGADMINVRRLARMLEQASPEVSAPTTGRVIPIGRYLRPASQYTLPLWPPPPTPEGEDR
jgi:hypothetical protein